MNRLKVIPILLGSMLVVSGCQSLMTHQHPEKQTPEGVIIEVSPDDLIPIPPKPKPKKPPRTFYPMKIDTMQPSFVMIYRPTPWIGFLATVLALLVILLIFGLWINWLEDRTYGRYTIKPAPKKKRKK